MKRSDIVDVTRTWLGTPYEHQASLLHVGTDCLGLLRGVWREVVGAEPEMPPPYTPDWAEARAEETLLGAARRGAGWLRYPLERQKQAMSCCSAWRPEPLPSTAQL